MNVYIHELFLEVVTKIEFNNGFTTFVAPEISFPLYQSENKSHNFPPFMLEKIFDLGPKCSFVVFCSLRLKVLDIILQL